MPIYEYTCRKCSQDFEHLARRLNEGAPDCPHCGAARPVKKLSVFSPREGRRGPGALPCAGGTCPSAAAQGAGCASGHCPLG